MKLEKPRRVRIPRRTFVALAKALRLDGELPAARRDGVYLFDDESELRVQVLERKRPRLSGDYTCGKVRIFVCPRCSDAKVLWTYAHELSHAWLDSYRRQDYFRSEVEVFADAFADGVFGVLGGRVGGDVCSRYHVPRSSGTLLEDAPTRRRIRAVLRNALDAFASPRKSVRQRP